MAIYGNMYHSIWIRKVQMVLAFDQIVRAQSKLVTNRSDIPHLGKGSCGPFLGRIYQRVGRQKVSWAGFWAKYLNLSPEPPCFPYLGKHPTSPNSCKVALPKVHFNFSTLRDVEPAWDEMVISSNWLWSPFLSTVIKDPTFELCWGGNQLLTAAFVASVLGGDRCELHQ